MHADLQSRARRRLGTVLSGKWRLDAVIGIGGMAAVYEGSHRNGKRAAIKILHPEFSLDADSRERFLREGYVANKVEHAGAVSVLDDDVDDEGCAYLVMELLQGETLEARRQRFGGMLPPHEALAAASQVLHTLEHAHKAGIVHRDLKPENLFCTLSGRVKVLDFGIARLRDGSHHSKGQTTGGAMGTPAFMPPEQARGRWADVDARSDLWAVGAILFNLVSGQDVHVAETVNEMLLAAMTRPVRSLAIAAPGASPELVALVDRALSFERDARFADATQMRRAVDAALGAAQRQRNDGAEPDSAGEVITNVVDTRRAKPDDLAKVKPPRVVVGPERPSQIAVADDPTADVQMVLHRRAPTPRGDTMVSGEPSVNPRDGTSPVAGFRSTAVIGDSGEPALSDSGVAAILAARAQASRGSTTGPSTHAPVSSDPNVKRGTGIALGAVLAIAAIAAGVGLAMHLNRKHEPERHAEATSNFVAVESSAVVSAIPLELQSPTNQVTPVPWASASASASASAVKPGVGSPVPTSKPRPRPTAAPAATMNPLDKR